MANPFFKFKQFTIYQDKCAMKVCTDSCLFGAWSTTLIKTKSLNCKNVLDVGSGTGLLSLMLAQQHDFEITAIEINKEASQQALENVASSNYHSQIKIVQGDIRSFMSDKKFDFIISNPPFFEDDLKSDSNSKNAAMHSTELTINELFDFVSQNLSPEGNVALLIPFHRSEGVEKLISNHTLFIAEKTLVKQSYQHHYFRVMYLLSVQNNHESICKEISIYDDNKQYTDEFIDLLEPYYLYL